MSSGRIPSGLPAIRKRSTLISRKWLGCVMTLVSGRNGLSREAGRLNLIPRREALGAGVGRAQQPAIGCLDRRHAAYGVHECNLVAADLQ